MEKLINKKALMDHIWLRVLKLSIDMEYSKSKVLKAEYDALSEIWNEIKSGKFDMDEDDISNDSPRFRMDEHGNLTRIE